MNLAIITGIALIALAISTFIISRQSKKHKNAITKLENELKSHVDEVIQSISSSKDELNELLDKKTAREIKTSLKRHVTKLEKQIDNLIK